MKHLILIYIYYKNYEMYLQSNDNNEGDYNILPLLVIT